MSPRTHMGWLSDTNLSGAINRRPFNCPGSSFVPDLHDLARSISPGSILKVTDPSDVPSSRLERYWREIDLDASGTVDFEESSGGTVDLAHTPRSAKVGLEVELFWRSSLAHL